MNKAFKTGLIAAAAVGLSLVGFGQAFGYGGSAGPATFIGPGLVIVGGNQPTPSTQAPTVNAPAPQTSLVSPNAPAQVLGVKLTRLDEVIAATHIGQRGADVVDLQNELKTAGYLKSTIQSTGWYGPLTMKAVIAYGKQNADFNLMTFLLSQVKRGERNEAVRQLQDELKTLGYFPGGISSTGFYGSITAKAVADYQAK